MEALSGVASGMAVASLSIQLIDSIATIKTFIRNVRDAQQELERLVDLLERLEALLEDVRALMERQTLLQAEHFPIPSMTISKCLKSCEKMLEPFHAMVDKYTPATVKVGTRMDKLKTGLRFSLKAKDVKDFETRIEREIGFLHASLGANCGAILMQLGPALLKNQNNKEATRSNHAELAILDSKSTIVSSKEDLTSLSTARTTRVSSSVIPVHWSLQRLGVHRRKIVRRIPGNSEQTIPGYENDHESIISEDYETTLLWSVLGYGLTWIQRRSFDIVLPSLSTFPLVEYFDREVRFSVKEDTIQEFQDLLRRRGIHPFSHDSYGESLLHVAAMYGRADIYLLLLKLGLKQSLNILGNSPLAHLLFWTGPSSIHGKATICRYILEETELSVDIGSDLDFSSATLFLHEDAFKTQLGIMQRICAEIGLFLTPTSSALAGLSGLDVKGDLLDHLQLGGGDLLYYLFDYCISSYESFTAGDMFLEWLSTSGLNAEQLVSNEIAKLGPGALLKAWPFDKRVVFQAPQTGEWSLSFEWALDEEADGYLLISEYEKLTVESEAFYYFDLKWPFADLGSYWMSTTFDKWEINMDLRFQRRMAAKARKERVRSGQKIPRSRMPGAWVN
ncbi:hypothetical protein BM1_08428 [Bipolaris maydis]|nr:hypothetical protein BM1_08428 [Bipolaris maydis]